MFQLIVSGLIENDRLFRMDRSRIFEYTDDTIANNFCPNGALDLSKITTIPAIFMEEGISDEIVRIGWISRADLQGREWHVHFQRDADLPRLTNSDIYECASELSIDSFEFSRNHWAIKNRDLFQVLYRKNITQGPSPTVFHLSSQAQKPNLVSIMMPFDASFNAVHRKLKSEIESNGYELRRADDFWLHDHIMQDIVELICTSAVVICDLSHRNSNVFYEAGISHTLGKKVILITQSMDDVPFDLRPIRCISYHNNGEGIDKLADEVTSRLQTIAPLGRVRPR